MLTTFFIEAGVQISVAQHIAECVSVACDDIFYEGHGTVPHRYARLRTVPFNVRVVPGASMTLCFQLPVARCPYGSIWWACGAPLRAPAIAGNEQEDSRTASLTAV